MSMVYYGKEANDVPEFLAEIFTYHIFNSWKMKYFINWAL